MKVEFMKATENDADKLRNHYFYQKCGYTITRKEKDGNVEIVIFEKMSYYGVNVKVVYRRGV